VTVRLLRSTASGAIVGTVLLAAALVVKPVSAEVALDAYVLFLGAVALFALVGATTESDPDALRSPYEQALEAPPEEAERPPELARLEREVALAVGSAFYEHFRLRPLLREIAGQRLESRFASDLDAPRGEARDSLPDHAWELLDLDRRPPRDRHAPGIEVERLEAIVDALERLEKIER
jgi:hypothetical protein